VKWTSLRIRGKSRKYLASICFNLIVRYFNHFTEVLQRFVAADGQAMRLRERLRTLTRDEIQRAIEQFSTEKNLVLNNFHCATSERANAIGLLEGISQPQKFDVYSYCDTRRIAPERLQFSAGEPHGVTIMPLHWLRRAIWEDAAALPNILH
jgi:hypothetical protein